MIKFLSKNITLTNALILTIVSTVVFIVFSILLLHVNVTYIALFSIIIFVVSYLFLSFSLNLFINEKIKIIYNTIGSLGYIKKERKKNEEKGDVLEIVNQVVHKWSEEKKKEIEELKKMEIYRREFIGNVSHELKTPIFNIQGYIHTLLEGGINDNTINTKFLEKSVKSINRMIALVEDLEEISKLESGELKLNETNFNLTELIQQVIDFMELKASKNNTSITIKSSKSIYVLADKNRIRQVLINLIDNAIKYGNQKNGKITISYYDFHKYYLIEIADNGIGIQEESIKRIFERFYRTDQSRSRDKGGTGLGLAIVKHIIEAHRQTISVRSTHKKGTTFSFTLKKT